MMSSIYYSPKDLVFWLLDYKEGTEFALYKDFPQVQILSMESEVEFGHDVLRKAVEVIAERGRLFKEVGAQNLASYNEKVGEDLKLPRIILFIDEFQELLRGDQRTQKTTNDLFDDILRRGRSFGINLVLSTQTLLGVDLDRSILSNMPLRIGLSMEEKDAAKIFSENNLAASFMEHPGQGIYNAQAGDPKANVAFQACFVDDDTLKGIQEDVKEHMKVALGRRFVEELEEKKFVFYGSNKGEYDRNPMKDVPSDKIYYGEPLGLTKEHNYFRLTREFGENIAMVGGETGQMLTTMYYVFDQLIKKMGATIHFANFSSSLQPVFETEFSEFGENIRWFDNQTTDDKLEEIFRIFDERKAGKTHDMTPQILAFSMIENSKFFSEKRTANRKRFEELIASGPEMGIHVMFTAIEFTSLRETEMAPLIPKFKKRFAFRGGSSVKLLTAEKSPAFPPRNKIVAIFEDGHRDLVRFKTYHKESIENALKGGEL